MQSIYDKYQLKHVINASGRMTILGVSTPTPEVVERVAYGLNNYFEIKDLVNKTGEYIANLLNVEAAVVVSCASAGIAQAVAAVIVQDDDDLLLNLHSSDKVVPREIILPKGHNVNFGAPVDTMVSLGGGKVVEAGFANECSAAQLAAKSPQYSRYFVHQITPYRAKSMLTVEQAAKVAHDHQLPDR